MNERQERCLIISDFNISNLAGYLSHDSDLPAVNAEAALYGQVMRILMSEDLTCWQRNPDVVVIWTRPQGVIESFKRVLNYQAVPTDEVLEQVDEYGSAIIAMSDRVDCAFVPTWVLPPYYRGFGMLDMKNELGVANLLMRMNLRLADNLEPAANVHLLDARKWVETAGKNAFNPKAWYLGKIPFGNGVFKEAVADIKASLRGVRGNAKKLIVVDLDETLWGGIVGDIGWENLKLGGHDHVGEAYVDFQRALKSLTNRGILLGIVSKNEESVALEAIESHPEMALTLEDFAGWKINWGDKAQNIVDLTSELNLGVQSVVFIDDNPVERARVREALPNVFVPEWPQDRTLYKKTLLSLRCFDAPHMSHEDQERTKMYVSERQRADLRKEVGSLDEWLMTLGIVARIEELNGSNLPRTTQLLNKTNQMNLSTRRMTESELTAWVDQQDRKLWTFRVSDKLGDSGLTGIISVELEDGRAKIVDFVLSCRVMGRKVEETMLSTAVKHARSKGVDEVYAQYVATPKNRPCFEFWKRSGFVQDESDNTFHWQTTSDYPVPEQITIEGGDFV